MLDKVWKVIENKVVVFEHNNEFKAFMVIANCYSAEVALVIAEGHNKTLEEMRIANNPSN